MRKLMTQELWSSTRRENGSALIITTLILLLVSMLVLTSIKDSEEESKAGARARASSRTLYAAEAGIQLALARLTQEEPNLDAFSIDLTDIGATVESRTRSEGSASDIDQVSLGEKTTDGYSVNIGGGATSLTRVYELNVTASYANSAVAELEARLSREQAEASGY
jgi:Tfp pilus assembly protein PilX